MDDAGSRRLKFVLFTMVLALALNGVSAAGRLGWQSATAITALVLVLDVLFVWRYRDAILGHWLLLGLIAGVLELAADWWLVARTGTLVYPGAEPHLWVSPAYMPLAWGTVLAQVGVIAAWLRTRLSLGAATLVTAAVSAAYIPVYEHLARSALWWHYRDTPMLSFAPYYIIAGEFLVALPLAAMAPAIARARPGLSAGLGLLEGAWMLPAFMLAFRVVGPCAGALVQFACGTR